MLLGFGWEVGKAGGSCAVQWQSVLQLVNLHGHGLGFAGSVSAPARCHNQSWLGAEQLIMPSLGCSPCLPWWPQPRIWGASLPSSRSFWHAFSSWFFSPSPHISRPNVPDFGRGKRTTLVMSLLTWSSGWTASRAARAQQALALWRSGPWAMWKRRMVRCIFFWCHWWDWWGTLETVWFLKLPPNCVQGILWMTKVPEIRII